MKVYSYICRNHKTMEFDKDFKKNFKIEGWLPPTTLTSVVDGKKYAISGGNWIHIPNDMTYEEVCAGFIDLRPTLRREKNLGDVYKEVKSSKGKATYKVSYKNSSWNCTCSGFSFRRKCSHVDGVKKDLKKLF